MSWSQFHPRRYWKTWWRRLSVPWQDRLVSVLSLIGVVLFISAVLMSISFLRMDAQKAQMQAVLRDGDHLAQRINTYVVERQEQLMRLARALESENTSAREFSSSVNEILRSAPEIRDITWLDSSGIVVDARHIESGSPRTVENRSDLEAPLPLNAERHLLNTVTQTELPRFALIPATDNTEATLALAIPIIHNHAIEGFVLARFNLTSLLLHSAPSPLFQEYAIALIDTDAHVVAGQSSLPTDQVAQTTTFFGLGSAMEGQTILLPQLNHAINLHLTPYEDMQYLSQRSMWLLVLVISLLTVWLLVVNWRHLRRRQRSQQTLVEEASFREAVENSLVTGMRALDLEGRITFVNRAFCEMTGWTREELIGQSAPYSFWHPDDRNNNDAIFKRMIVNHKPHRDFAMRVLRKNGTTFEARMYMAPLMTNGVHTGWVSSMTDITEPNRIKQQLTNAYDRFTRVLDGLDVAVSVAPLGCRELLFGNQTYRQWYGEEDTAQGHMRMLMTATRPDEQDNDLSGLPTTEANSHPHHNNTEIYVPELERWLEVRSRYLEWVDGRLVQMVVATDITARRQAEELSVQHEAAAQAASRLVTMGEMASSVAHELNQPLTAINNYCSGMISRVRNGTIEQQTLLDALEKTSKQAQRAGQVIQRIRSFVKRSTPKYSLISVDAIVSEVVELSEIDLRRRQVTLHHNVERNLPLVLADQILIEQVLVNLIKNAAESIDNSQQPSDKRKISLRVALSRQADQRVVEFIIDDTGSGMSEEALTHLFEAFFTTKREGLGIGLNLCRSIVESHQGRLSAQNLYNDAGDTIVGCRFSFWIPVANTATSTGSAL